MSPLAYVQAAVAVSAVGLAVLAVGLRVTWQIESPRLGMLAGVLSLAAALGGVFVAAVVVEAWLG